MSQTPIILIADKEQNSQPPTAETLDLEFNCTIEHVSTEEALDASLHRSTVSILVLDLEFSYSCENLEFIHTVKSSHPETVILPMIPASKPQLAKHQSLTARCPAHNLAPLRI